MHNNLFEAALNISAPWFVQGVDFDESNKLLTIGIDFVAGTRFPHPDAEGLHPVHDTQIKRLIWVSCTGCRPSASGWGNRVPATKSIPIVNNLLDSSKSTPCTNHGAEMFKAASNKLLCMLISSVL